MSRNEHGEMTVFRIVCQKKQFTTKHIRQGIDLKPQTLCECPFEVMFRWRPDRRQFMRCNKMNFQHTHPLEIHYKSFIRNEAVIREIKLYIEC